MSVPVAAGSVPVRRRLLVPSRLRSAGTSLAVRRVWSRVRRLIAWSLRRRAPRVTPPDRPPDARWGSPPPPGGPAPYVALLATYLGPQRFRFALLALLLLAGTAMELASPRVLGRFVDAAGTAGPPGALLGAVLLFLALTLAAQSLAVVTAVTSEGVAWTATNALRADLALHCLRQDHAFHTRHSPGELIERIDGDVTALAGFFTEFVVHIAGTGLLAAGVLVLATLEDGRVGAVLVVYAAVSVAVLAGVQGVGVPHFVAAWRAAAGLSAFLEERLVGLEDVQGAGGAAYVLRGLAARSRELLRRARRSQLMGSVVATTSVGLFAVGSGLVFALGALLVSGGQLTVGAVYVLFRYTDLLTFNLRVLTLQLDDFQRAVAGVARIRALSFAAGFGSTAEDAGESLPPGVLSVAFRGITYAYPGAAGGGREEPAVRDLTFTVAAGETLGLVGRSGSGKTTVGRLLFRLCEPDAGVVRLGGVDVRRVALAGLRRGVGYVPQDAQLLRASVRDNVTLFDATVADADVERAFAELGLWPWYQALPRGLDAPLAPGAGASAGEAQLLALTRTFLRRPRLVVLDEVTARLDPATERLLDGALDRLLAGRTAVVIAHRLATLRRAHRVLALERGRIEAEHRREDLGAAGLVALLGAADRGRADSPDTSDQPGGAPPGPLGAEEPR